MSATRESSIHGIWTSRWTFILAATGSAVGLGNIWKFPYIAGENGGGAFVLVYLLCVAFIGVPIMMAEVMLGRRGRQSPINVMIEQVKVVRAKKVWRLLGWSGVLAGFLILSYYSVIAGWVLDYVVRMAQGVYQGATAAEVEKSFDQLVADPYELILFHSVFMLMTMVVVAKGVNRGLERAVRILMPALFILLLIMLGYAINSGGFEQGFHFMFDFDFSKLSLDSLLTAMGHAFFTLSLGMGAIMVYGAYMPKNASIAKTTITVAGLDTLVAIVAGLAIFPIVFANGLEPGKGPGLLFVSLPIAFGNMPGGQVFGTLFFLLVTFAAWSSSISLVEPAVAWLIERHNFSRLSASALVGGMVWALGLLTVFSFNLAKDFKPIAGFNMFELLDFLTANLMLPLGGMFIAIFVGWVMRRRAVKDEMSMKSFGLFNLWIATIRIIAPLAVLVVFGFELYGRFGG